MPKATRWIWYPVAATVRFVMRNGRRIAISLIGFALVLVGIVLLVLPGPGLLVIVAGLAVLGTEYVWAQRTLNYARRKAVEAKDRALRRPRRDKSDEKGPAGP
jgi:uncharacterized protein (TIGR02611 family)